jgi:leucine-zipper-like transcriptional regulator 1
MSPFASLTKQVLPSANSGNPPSPRDRHVSVAFANSFYVHGGFDGIARDASLFSFDFSTMAWREVIASQGRPPSARHSHAAVVHNHSMYIFGGYDGSYKSDLHEFDFTLSRWSSVPAVGRRPRPRYRATCVVYKDLMVLYGGHDGTKHLSDTFTFDFNTLTWNTLITDGVQPIPRDSHVAVVHGNSMYVFGGSSGVALNDFHELQLPSTNSASPVGGAATAVSGGSAMALSSSASNAASNTPSTTTARWRPIRTPQNENSHQPNRRFCHVAVTYNDSMYVFGGYDGADRLNSFIKFDFAMYDLSFDIPQSVLINDLRSFVNNEKLSDITFIVEDEPIFAHKLMLMRCSYFQALFSGHMRESDMDTIRIEQVRYPIFLGILEYLYTDQLSSMPFHAAMEYFEAADLFCIPRLKTMCEKRMLQHITIENASSIFHAADVHSASGLRQKTKKYMLTHFEEVSKTTAFEEMGRQNVDLVFELLHSR